MLLPAGEQAVVEDAKLLDYVLNPEHPVGRHHAGLFERLPGRPSPFGEKFEMRCPVRGPLGPRPVLAVWMREEGQASPRLITYYVE